MNGEREALIALVDAIAPLMNRENCSPFICAWELDPDNMDVDGQRIWEQTKAAWDSAREALADEDEPEPVYRFRPVSDGPLPLGPCEWTEKCPDTAVGIAYLYLSSGELAWEGKLCETHLAAVRAIPMDERMATLESKEAPPG